MLDKRLLDKEWRVNHLYKIIDRNAQRVQFKRNRAQEHFERNKHTFNIILKSRRLGFTTFEAIDNLDDVLFNKNFQSLFIAHTKDDAKRIFEDKIKFAWDNMLQELRDLYILDSDKSDALRVNFGDGTISSITVANSGRGGTYMRGHVSEFGKLCLLYPERASEIITGTIPSVPNGGRFDIESTAEGEVGHFHDMFWEAWDRGEPKYPKEFKAHFYNWLWDDTEIAKTKDEHIQSFLTSADYAEFHAYREKLKEQGIEVNDQQLTYYYMQWISVNRSWQKMRQEFPSTPEEAFIGSGNKMFDQDMIAQLETVEGKRDLDWIIYKEFVPGRIYVMGADVAEGIGKDSSTAVVLDITDAVEVVAEFASKNIDPDRFATELARYGTKYGSCLIAPEVNNMGYSTVSRLKDIYKNVYKDVDFKKNFETKNRFNRPQKTLRYGWRTTGVTKPKMMFDLKEAINNGEIKINSKHIKTELRTYDQEDLSQIRFDDAQTNHWDRIMALAIALQMRLKVPRKRTVAYSYPSEKF